LKDDRLLHEDSPKKSLQAADTQKILRQFLRSETGDGHPSNWNPRYDFALRMNDDERAAVRIIETTGVSFEDAVLMVQNKSKEEAK
jgi:hypothetical protein